MISINKILDKWLDELNKFSFKNYEELPDIDLYMDQMITYLERQLQPFALSTLDKQITSSMINNYVKGECIPSPTCKRYNKEHIALILQICLLKRACSIADIKQILDSNYLSTDFRETYNDFKENSDKILHETSQQTKEKLANVETNDHQALLNLALELSLTANANIMIAKRILSYIEIQNNLKK